MSEFTGKRFFFTGKFSFFSDEQRDDALNFHGAFLLNSFSESVDFIVIGNEFDQSILDQQTNETVYSEWDFSRFVIRPMNSAEETESGTGDSETDLVSVEVDIEDLVEVVNNLEEKKIYSCLFVYPKNGDESPVIRSLFSYTKEGNHVLFACRGLTDDSSGFPLAQFGILSVSKNVTAAAFESYDDQPIEDELYVAKADSLEGIGFYEAVLSDKPLKLSKKSIAALERLDAFQDQCYFIDDTEDGNYRVAANFYEQHKDDLDADDCWIDDGFSEEIYYAAESVLSTGKGWMF